MSLYEVLDRFVATGVLACAGLVGTEMPAGAPLDGAAFSARLRVLGLNEPFGVVLDGLAHAVWFARERHGIPLDTAERHAAGVARLLGEVRFGPGEVMTAAAAAQTAPRDATSPIATTLSGRLAALWLAKSGATGVLSRDSLDAEICSFLLAEMLALVVDPGTLLPGLAPALVEHRIALTQAAAAVASQAANAPPPMPQPGTALTPHNVPPATAVAELQTRHRLGEGALRRFQAILAQQPMSAEQRLARLDELGGWLDATVTHLRKPGNDSAELREVKHAAAAALEAGDLERAMERLKAVREHMRENRRRAEARIADELQSLRYQMVEEAAATARMGELALARMELDAAADHFADAAGQLPASEPVMELEYRQRQAEALAAKAETSGDAHALDAAAHAFRICRRLLLADTDPRTLVRINVGLGDMLTALGERKGHETTELEEAVAVYADALTAVDRAAKPMQWALVQLSQGAALIELGQRRDRDLYWRQAATVLMPVLEVFESRNATDLAEAARAKLRALANGLAQQEQQPLPRQARSA